MKDSTRGISPLRRRMLEDMRLRKLAPYTQAGYMRAVRRLAGYLRRPPDTATIEDLRNFLLHLVRISRKEGHRFTASRSMVSRHVGPMLMKQDVLNFLSQTIIRQ